MEKGEWEEKLLGVVDRSKDVLKDLLGLFAKAGAGSLESVKEKLGKLKGEFGLLYEKLAEKVRKEDREVSKLFSIIDSMQVIIYNIEGIAFNLDDLVENKIPLSDKAINEINELNNSLQGLFTDLSDLLKVKNKTLAKALIREAREVSKKADNFSLEHEGRVISGICLPKASPIYLNVLASIKGISYSISRISKRISEDG